MTTLHIDFETRSELDLREVGLYRYARHESTDAWCMAAAFSDEEPYLWTPEKRVEKFITWVAAGGAVHAHNAPFELAIWNNIMVPRYGWPELKPEQTFCSMARAYAMGLPGALEDAALALGLAVLKDTEGRSLMLRMARPRSKPGLPLVWWDEPEKLARLYAYCQQDVRVEREVSKRLMPLSATERRVWLLDYKINQRGVQVDTQSVAAAIKLVAKVKGDCDVELSKVTNGAVQAATALPALKEWLATQGIVVESLDKQAVADLLGGVVPLQSDAHRALTLRQEAGKASTAKFNRIAEQVDDEGRLHNMYQYHGAHTGRWAGRGVQTTNLVRDMPKAKSVETILRLVREGKDAVIDAIYGAPMSVVSRCMRSFFVAPPGTQLISGDFANVEGRGAAWFAGEEWKLDAFIAADEGRGPGIYELAYSRMFNVPVESVKNPSEERQIGKVSELAFGYQGGAGSFHAMGKNYNVKVAPAKADEFKNAWRAAHPRIKATWYEVQRAAIGAVRTPGSAFKCGASGREATFKMAGSFLWLKLPSGRVNCYPYPKLLESEYGPQLTYMARPGQDDSKIIHDAQNASNWARVSTYGGALFNNIIQGFCRDLLSELMLGMDAAGAALVMHTYDDLTAEVADAKAERARAAMEQMMRRAPAWAAGLPLFAEVKVMRRYGK